jgi:hypothetical protein
MVKPININRSHVCIVVYQSHETLALYGATPLQGANWQMQQQPELRLPNMETMPRRASPQGGLGEQRYSKDLILHSPNKCHCHPASKKYFTFTE